MELLGRIRHIEILLKAHSHNQNYKVYAMFAGHNNNDYLYFKNSTNLIIKCINLKRTLIFIFSKFKIN